MDGRMDGRTDLEFKFNEFTLISRWAANSCVMHAFRNAYPRCAKCFTREINDKIDGSPAPPLTITSVQVEEEQAHDSQSAAAHLKPAPAQKHSTDQEIVFLRPWKNGYNDSWLVSYDGFYSNDRPPHVQVGRDRMQAFYAGQRFTLRNIHTVGPATMWEVADTDMHFTVAFQRY